MKIQIVADSSANYNINKDIDVRYAPLSVNFGDKEFVDDKSVDMQDYFETMKSYSGKSGSSCPSVQCWQETFNDADVVLGVSITSAISGCYNASQIAIEEYLSQKPGAKAFIMDSLSTGPELQLLIEKYDELIKAGESFEDIVEKIKQYLKTTHLAFSLTRLENFAKNGRVSPLVAKAVGILGIRVVGKASDEGTLEPMYKIRGEKKSMAQLYASMKDLGFKGGKVRLSHTQNPEAAETFAEIIKADYPDCDLNIVENGVLCAYYCEEGGLLVGFEG